VREGLGTEFDRAEYGVAYQLHLAGYDTFAVTANELLTPAAMPVLRGFNRFRGVTDIDNGTIPAAAIEDIDLRLKLFGCRTTNRNRAMIYYSAERILTEVLAQMRASKGPWFGFVNLVDAHEPYAPDPQQYAPETTLPPGFDGDVLQRALGPELTNPDAIADAGRRDYVKQKIADVGSPKLVAIDLPAANRAIYHQRYLAKVREMDATLHEFLDAARREKLLANTVVIVTSDHGEAFGEDDLVTHMFRESGAIEVTHHVPLVIVTPASIPLATHVIDRRVSAAAIAATIYDFAGVDASVLRARFTDSPRSLVPLFTRVTVPPTRKIALPQPNGQIDSEANRELQRRLRAIGYLQ
jgi:arylsulfatase A-like enzyme